MASPNDSAGRIHKKAFIISTLVFFIICILSVFARFYIRLRIQRQVGVDDAFLLFGTGCLIAAVGLLFNYVDKMYMVEAFITGVPGATASPNFIEDAFWFQKVIVVALLLTWCSLIAVKFGFLFIFKKLVNRLRPMLIFWWITVVFNAAVSAYGAAVYVAACPHFYSFKSLQCGRGPGVELVFRFAISQMIVDIFGDLLILYIPCRLIWQIKAKWAQKVALVFSLCLTVLVIMCTVIRAAGIRSGKAVDFAWEVYWQYIAASFGLSMMAATAFRSLFVSHRKSHGHNRQGSGSEHRRFSYTGIKLAFGKLFSVRSWYLSSGPSKDSGGVTSASSQNTDVELGKVERGTITGLRTTIHGFGRDKRTASQMMHSQILNEISEYNDNWPLTNKNSIGGITVSRTFEQRSRDTVNENQV